MKLKNNNSLINNSKIYYCIIIKYVLFLYIINKISPSIISKPDID